MESGDSIGSTLGLCQMCWEWFCSDNWWYYVAGEPMVDTPEWINL